VTVPIDGAAGLTLEKSSTAPPNAAAGDVITYTFAVSNTGSVTLSNVAVTDGLAGLSGIDCGGGSNAVATLPVGGSATCTATYQLTQADIDSGAVTNTATANGTRPGGDPVTAEDTVTTPLLGARGVALTKTSGGVNDVDGNGVDAGDTITYFFVVTNTGTSTLDGITVNDPKLGGVVPCGSGPLAPGQSRQCEPGVYPITESDFATTLQNTATVSGTTSDGGVLSSTAVALTIIPPACSVASTTTTSTTTSTPSTTIGIESVTATSETTTSTSPEPSEPSTTSSTSSTTTSTTPSSTTTTTTTTLPPPAPFRRSNGFAGAGAELAPSQVDPCAIPSTTTTSTTVPTGGGGGGGTLPATGDDSASTLIYAMILTAAGIATLSIIRRRRPTR